nr:PREDICTED: ent-copalyl diphosphate synthase, chloroplastic-like [Daucus carota subsp. sativus]
MSPSHSTSSLLAEFISPTFTSPPLLFHPQKLFCNIRDLAFSVDSVNGQDKRVKLRYSAQCSAVSRSHTATDVEKNLSSVIYWQEILESHKQEEDTKIREFTKLIREIFNSMDDGDINVSAYDTAWVALVEDINKTGIPQFPSSLQWIADNQLPDGSWGDKNVFLAYERILCTLACVVALRTWNIHPQNMERGLLFIRENINKLEDDEMEHMTIGFEVAFPSLVEIAETLNIKVISKDLPIIQAIYAQRDLKLSKIPKDIVHKMPTTMLFSLEGMAGMEWEKLLKLQCEDGSFLSSPSSTAYALMQTKDKNCFSYLSKVIQRFDGGVPNAYPVDMFEHCWAVDRLERLGVSRYFKYEIKDCMDYVYRYWTSKGICWGRNINIADIDDTSMAFRLLRLHGYNVSQDVFRNFESKGEFFAWAGQSNQAVTGMLDLLKASQVMLPGENVLEDAKTFSYEFLRRKQANNQLLDKWIIMKDLPGEVEYALDIPWYASLPRLETCFYLDQYGGEDDVWIGKTLYRMPRVNNNIYLELAKLDYAKCQTIHQLEWSHMKEWCARSNLDKLGLSENSLLLSYYLAASSLFEPEVSNLRYAWAKTDALVETIRSYFGNLERSVEQRKAFAQEFENTSENSYFANHGRYSIEKKLLGTLVATLKQLILDAKSAHGIDIYPQLHQAWTMWLLKWQEEGDVDKAKAQLLEQTINICAGRILSNEILSHPHYKTLSTITNRLCHQLSIFRKVQNEKSRDTSRGGITTMEIESDMRELVRLVFCNSEDSLHPELKHIFFMVARTFYYTAYCDVDTVNGHINKVLLGSTRM